MSVQWDYEPQRQLLPALREELHSRGLTFGLWEAEPQPGSGAQLANDATALGASPDHYTAQAETPRDWEAIVADFRDAYPEMPAAVVTTFGGIGALEGGGYDPAVAKPVIDAGFYCLTESYQNANPQATPANLDFVATVKLGWPRSQPTIGVWGGYPASSYLGGWLPPDYWVWLAETMTSADWDSLRAHNLG